MSLKKKKDKKNNALQKLKALILGIIVAFIILEILLRLGGLVFLLSQDYRNAASLRNKSATYRIMCLGDSTTALGGQDAYPLQLENILNAKNQKLRFGVINKGAILVDTLYILEHLEENISKYNPDMVTIMSGINDRYTPYTGDIPQDHYFLLDKLKAYKFIKLLIRNAATQIRQLSAYVPEKEGPQVYPIEEDLKKRVQTNTADEEAYIELGRLYRQNGRYVESEQAFIKAVEINPREYIGYFEAGLTYMDQSKYSLAEDMFKQAIQRNPQYFMAYMQLAFTYKLQAKYDEAVQIITEGINLSPRENVWGYSELGFCYKAQGKYDKAEEFLNKSIELLPLYFWAYAELADCYKIRGKYAEAESVLKKAIQANSEDDKGFAELGRLYKQMGRQRDSAEYIAKANVLRSKRYNAQTRYNYRMIKNILDRKGIRLVCIQYPLRSIKLLRKMFSGEEGIIFVDNDKTFQDAIKEFGFNRYFEDMFAGDFGHCSAQGNRLIAENIAKEIEGKMRPSNE